MVPDSPALHHQDGTTTNEGSEGGNPSVWVWATPQIGPFGWKLHNTQLALTVSIQDGTDQNQANVPFGNGRPGVSRESNSAMLMCVCGPSEKM